jgi:hypothetical protein
MPPRTANDKEKLTMKDAIEKNQPQPVEIVAPLHFLITCSKTSLENFELAKLADIANLRSQLHSVLDELMDASNQAALARLFRAQGRERILRALESTPDPIAEAKEKIKKIDETPEESCADIDFVPLLSLNPGQAHRTASITYQKRNVAEGKCSVCPQPLAHHSVRYCEKHLAKCRERARARAKKLNKSPHGRAPGTLAALAESRKKHGAK